MNPNSLGVFPASLCTGKPPKEQVILSWIYNMTLWGKEWTFQLLSGMCGIGPATIRKDCEALVNSGALARVPVKERKGSKPCYEYVVSDDNNNARAVVVEKAKKPAAKYPPWVFRAMRIWKDMRGAVPPRLMFNALKIVVQTYGEERTMRGLFNFARNANPKFNPSPTKFAIDAKLWMPEAVEPERQGQVKTFADLNEGSQ